MPLDAPSHPTAPQDQADLAAPGELDLASLQESLSTELDLDLGAGSSSSTNNDLNDKTSAHSASSHKQDTTSSSPLESGSPPEPAPAGSRASMAPRRPPSMPSSEEGQQHSHDEEDHQDDDDDASFVGRRSPPLASSGARTSRLAGRSDRLRSAETFDDADESLGPDDSMQAVGRRRRLLAASSARRGASHPDTADAPPQAVASFGREQRSILDISRLDNEMANLSINSPDRKRNGHHAASTAPVAERASSRLSVRQRRRDNASEGAASTGEHALQDASTSRLDYDAPRHASSSQSMGHLAGRSHRAVEAASGSLAFPAQTRSPLRSSIPLEFRRPAEAPGDSRSRVSSNASASVLSPRLPHSPLLAPGDTSASSVGLRPRSSMSRIRHAYDSPSLGASRELEHDGRSATPSSRLHNDASSVRRQLARGAVDGSEDADSIADMRDRKVSASSSISQRSGGSEASSARLALRRAGRATLGAEAPPNGAGHRHDVFSQDRDVPPLPSAETYRSPKTSLSSTSSERLSEMRARREDLRSSLGISGMRQQESIRAASSLVRPASRGPSVSGMSESSQRGASGPSLRSPYATVRDGAPPSSYSRFSSLGPMELRQQRSQTSLGMAGAADLSGTWRGPALSRQSMLDAGSVSSRATMSRQSSNALSSISHGSSSRAVQHQSPTKPALHTSNATEALEQFTHYFSASTTAQAYAEAGDTETVEMVRHMEQFGNSAIYMNEDLQALLRYSLQAQMEAELSGDGQALDKWLAMDKALSNLLRQSDEQVRNLTSGLFSLMRADKERERLRRSISDAIGGGDRPESRMSSIRPSPSRTFRDVESNGLGETSPRRLPPRSESRLASGPRSASRLGGNSGFRHSTYSAEYDSPSAYVSPHLGADGTRVTSRRGSVLHGRSTSEVPRSIDTSRRQASLANTSYGADDIKAPVSLSPRRSSLSVAAVSRGELAGMLDDAPPRIRRTPSRDSGRTETSAYVSRRNTISVASDDSRRSSLSPTGSTAMGNSPRPSLHLSNSPHEAINNSLSKLTQTLGPGSRRYSRRLTGSSALDAA